jgi:hypothetical protein
MWAIVHRKGSRIIIVTRFSPHLEQIPQSWRMIASKAARLSRCEMKDEKGRYFVNRIIAHSEIVGRAPLSDEIDLVIEVTNQKAFYG